MRNKTSLNWSRIGAVGLRSMFMGAVLSGVGYFGYAMFYSTYNREDNEINLILNKDVVQAVDSGDSGADVAHGWYDKIAELPGRPVFFVLENYDNGWDDAQDDRLFGVIEASYKFLYNEGDEFNNRYVNDYQKLHEYFDLNAAKVFSYRAENGALILEDIRLRVEQAIEQEFRTIKSDDFPEQKRSVSSRIVDSINDQFIDLRWPIRLESLDLNGIRISPEAELRRADRPQPEPTTPEQNDLSIANNADIDLFTDQAIEFLRKWENEGYPSEIASEMFCLYLNENAKPDGGEPMSCMRPQIIMPAAE